MRIRDLTENLRQTALVGGADLIAPMLQRLERLRYGLPSIVAQRCQLLNVEAHGLSAFLTPSRVYRPKCGGHIGRIPCAGFRTAGAALTMRLAWRPSRTGH